MENITIPKKLSRGGDLVVVRRKDFELFERWKSQTNDALAKVTRGQKEYRQGKLMTARSPHAFR